MSSGSTIVSLTARQVYTERGHPGIEATVRTENGATGVAVCTAGISVGVHEVAFAYDGGSRFRGKGVMRAVENVNKVIAPALVGADASRQLDIDSRMLRMGKLMLGGNATAAVSAAVLKAGAASLGVPLYQHIGGVNACVLPVPGASCMAGSDRFGGGLRSGGKPSYEFVCYGFDTFSEASYAGWDIATEWASVIHSKLGVPRTIASLRPIVGPGVVKHDREIWDLMVETINRMGYEGKIGIQVDVAAGTYWEKDHGRFVGLFSAGDKTRDDLLRLYEEMTAQYPFVILEDPLDEVDYEGHAILTRLVDIQIVGDDLFTTNPARVQEGANQAAANCVLLKVNQIGTISEALEMVELAYRNGYGVMPCSSRGEGDTIADYSVGLNCGTIRGSAVGPSGNRLLQIETELGGRARFLGAKGIKRGPTSRVTKTS